MSFIDISYLHFITIYFYMSKLIISDTTRPDHGWSINGTQKLSVSYILHAFLELTATKKCKWGQELS